MEHTDAFFWRDGDPPDGLLSRVLSTMSEGVLIVAGDGTFLGHNLAAESILGIGGNQLVGRDLADEEWRPVHSDGTPFALDDYPAMRTLTTGEPHTDVMGVARPDGTLRWLRVASTPLVVGGNLLAVATFADVSELRATAGVADHLARNDLLTGVPNRIMFEQLVEAALDQHPDAGCAVIAIGIDHFGATNKHLGPQAADDVLIETARRLEHLSPEGSAVGRVGDDQFALLLPMPPPEPGLQRLAESVREGLSSEIALAGEHHLPSITVGVAIDGDGGTDHLIGPAIEALEAAKRHERGSVRFFSGRDPAEGIVYQRSQEIRRAIAAGTVRLWYQPVIDLSTGEPVGAEALFRLEGNGQRSALTPDILGVLGPRIARHVLTLLIEDAAVMHSAGTLPRYIGVNLTAPDLLAPAIHDQVLAAGATFSELGGTLQVEVSEQVGLHDITGVAPAIASLRDAGIEVALDDFGTGSNSLALLRELPLDGIKLDPSFVSGAMTHSTDRAIVKAAVALSDELGLSLVAEGVETEGILAFIRGAGIRFAQGYLFDQPGPLPNGTA